MCLYVRPLRAEESRKLDLLDTEVTRAGLDQLKKSLPSVEVETW